MMRVRERLLVVVPLTLLAIVGILYLNTRSMVRTSIICLAVPFSAIGAFWFLYLLGYNMSVAVWVGLIALLGVDAETGVFMLLLPGPRVRTGQTRRTPAQRARTARSGHRRRGHTPAAEAR